MPGICGLFSVCPVAGLSSLHEEMTRRMMHAPEYSENAYVDPNGRLALGHVSRSKLGKSPFAVSESGSRAVMHGEVYDYARHRRTLEASGIRFRGTSHTELLLLGFEARGASFLRELNGSFAAALWDARQDRLVLINDRFGMKPLYYAEFPDKLIFASEIKSLLVHSDVAREINPRGLAQFFTFGQFLGQDTLFENIETLPAATIATYD